MERRSIPRGIIQRSVVVKVNDGALGGGVCRAVMIDQSDGGVCISIPYPVATDSEVAMRLDDGECVIGKVRYCRRIAEAEYAIGVEADAFSGVVDRRSENRYPVTIPAFLTILRPPGAERREFMRHPVEVLEVSRNGAGVISSVPAECGTAVIFELSQSEIFGVVRNCIAAGSQRYRIGIAVTEIRSRNKSSDAMMALFAEPTHPPLLADWTTPHSLRNPRMVEGQSIHTGISSCSTSFATEVAVSSSGSSCCDNPGHGDGILGDCTPADFDCAMRRLVERWKMLEVPLILVQEIQGTRSLCLLPQMSVKSPPGSFIMQISFATSSLPEVRLALQGAVDAADETWVEEADRCFRLR